MGLATARLLAISGANISLADIDSTAVQAAAESLQEGSDQHMYNVVDVRNSEAVESWIADTIKRFGRIDGAVNMAGIITVSSRMYHS